MDKVQFNP